MGIDLNINDLLIAGVFGLSFYGYVSAFIIHHPSDPTFELGYGRSLDSICDKHAAKSSIQKLIIYQQYQGKLRLAGSCITQ